MLRLLCLACCACAVLGQSVMPLTSIERDALLDEHNKIRSALGIANLEYSTVLEEFAKTSALRCQNQHTVEWAGSSPYGENIYWSWTSDDSYDAKDQLVKATKSWASEVSANSAGDWKCIIAYYFKDVSTCGHYSQIVWRKTTKVGCAVTYCGTSGGSYVFCEYEGPGNLFTWSASGQPVPTYPY